MAKSKKAKQLEVVAEVELENGAKIIKYEDGSMEFIPAPVKISAEDAASLFPTDDEEEEEDDDDSDDDDDSEDDSDDDDEDSDEEDDEEEEEEITPESLKEMDFEELEDVCEDKELDIDPDDYDEDEVEKLRKDVAKALGIKLPASTKKSKKGKK